MVLFPLIKEKAQKIELPSQEASQEDDPVTQDVGRRDKHTVFPDTSSGTGCER